MKQEMMGWQWHQLDHVQITCTLLLRDYYVSTSSLGFLQAGCSSWCTTNSVKALKAVGCWLVGSLTPPPSFKDVNVAEKIVAIYSRLSAECKSRPTVYCKNCLICVYVSLSPIVVHFMCTAIFIILQALFITGSIERSANLPVFSLLRGRFWGFFAPQGRYVAPMGVKFGTPIGATTRV